MSSASSSTISTGWPLLVEIRVLGAPAAAFGAGAATFAEFLSGPRPVKAVLVASTSAIVAKAVAQANVGRVQKLGTDGGVETRGVLEGMLGGTEGIDETDTAESCVEDVGAGGTIDSVIGGMLGGAAIGAGLEGGGTS